MAVVDPKRIAGRAREVMSGFTIGQRAVVAVGAVALVIAALYLSKWSSKPSYTPLFTNLSQKDAAAITAKLDSDKVPYTLAEGGTTVQVPGSVVYKERIAMAAANLPGDSSNTGYDLLDKQGLSTNDFTQHVDYQRAVQGELQDTIEAIDGVDSAKVNLVIPTDDVFASDTGSPSASVLVKTTGNNPLTSGQVQAIIHLVASSVQGMTAQEVTLTDGTGKVLAAPGVDASTNSDARLEQTTALQNQLEQQAQTQLDAALGAGHAKVAVSADLNMDSSNFTENTYSVPTASPAPGASAAVTPSIIPLNQSTSNEQYSGSGASAAVGVLGVAQSGASPSTPSTGTGTTGSTSGTGNGYSKTINDQTNAINQRQTSTTVTPGAIQRLSVSVLLDQSAIKAGVNVSQLQAAVSNAVGLQPTRGDTIAMTSIPFSSDATSATGTGTSGKSGSSSSSKSGGLMSKVGLAIPALGLILVLVAAIRGVRKVERTPLLEPQERLELEAARRALAAVERRQLDSAAEAHALPGGGDQGALPGRAQDELGAMADRQPDEVAALLRNWLAESK